MTQEPERTAHEEDMTSSTLSFGDTFTLPITGDHEWEIRDIRPPLAHLERATDWTASARNTVSLENAVYSPDAGWHVSPGEKHHRTIQEQLSELTVNLPHRSAEDYAATYRRMLGTETRREIGDILNLTDTWTKGTTIDPLALRAHVAAQAACAAAQVSIDGALYQSVFTLTLSTIKEQQA